jgi:hypothetical protein
VGLGRYGDTIDPNGWQKALRGLGQLLETGGRLYLSTPAGYPQRVEFNAHRVFDPVFLSRVVQSDFLIERFAYITDDGSLVDGLDANDLDSYLLRSLKYGCAIWSLRKL